ncbi:MAG: peptide deformylase [Patescibacteria group bacterium]|nr:peptide deformylase [Patescibacteria group bacterium]
MLEIITHPNNILRQKARKLERSEIKSAKIQKLINEMIETMNKKQGLGLAAPQINQSLQIIIVQKNNETVVFINPKILKKSWRKDVLEEGCLSVPEVYCEVKRAKKIKIQALDRNGEVTKFNAKGLFARIIQHEIEHLDGILIIDKQGKCEKPPKL